MPRPAAAQFAYGSCTVIVSALVMLLLSQTSSGPGIALVTLASLALGLLVALKVPLPAGRGAAGRPTAPLTPAGAGEPLPTRRTGQEPAAPRVSAAAGDTVRGRAA
ncbi:hypothetical protein AB0M23_05095 [Streptomyces sp. NPDC052077]|uniref:hypothetical protein n=1 Tax=Streptomyces sp. NPDC052077 TaxID=3154757 RepID=UPI0034282EBB